MWPLNVDKVICPRMVRRRVLRKRPQPASLLLAVVCRALSRDDMRHDTEPSQALTAN